MSEVTSGHTVDHEVSRVHNVYTTDACGWPKIPTYFIVKYWIIDYVVGILSMVVTCS